ncbi:MAG: FAD:protein FMN transferase, partial [bacterium]
MKFYIPILFFIFISCGNLPNDHDVYIRLTGFAQGTTYHITYLKKGELDLQDKIDSLLHDFDHSLSTYDSTSIISRINRNDPQVEIDEKFKVVFNTAREVYEKSGGTFDITVAPIVNAWGFYLKDGNTRPDSNHIFKLLQYVGMDKVRLDGNKLIKDDLNVKLDVNAIAQGYAVDLTSSFLDSLEIQDYLVEIGGEIRAKGKNPKGEAWSVGIDKPIDDNHFPGSVLQEIILLRNKSLATSGNNRKYFVQDGVKYSHSIDPKTGFPVKDRILSATIITENCIIADAYAT